MKIIGLTGAARSGKDTVALYLDGHFGFSRLALATPLKQGIEAMFGLPQSMWSDEKKELEIPGLGVSPRRMAQTLGTEWGRNTLGEDIWLKVLERRIDELQVDQVVITDVRFANEARWVKDRGGLLIRVERPNVRAIAAHSSEAGIAPEVHDVVIVNDGTLEDLRVNTHRIVRPWMLREAC